MVRMIERRLLSTLVPAAAVLLLSACGGGQSSAPTEPSATTTQTPTTHAAPPKPRPSSAPSAGALAAEANAAATGDIPDNQVFLVFRNEPARYSIKYPEGWAESGSGSRVTFRDKNNIVRVFVAKGSAPTVASVRRDLARLKNLQIVSGPESITIGAARAVKVVYTTVSAPTPVTGKRVTLDVDRYYLTRAGREAIVDLGTPHGVDNVDAYRLIVESFRWK
jgi:hypothetical protein